KIFVALDLSADFHNPARNRGNFGFVGEHDAATRLLAALILADENPPPQRFDELGQRISLRLRNCQRWDVSHGPHGGSFWDRQGCLSPLPPARQLYATFAEVNQFGESACRAAYDGAWPPHSRRARQGSWTHPPSGRRRPIPCVPARQCTFR